MKKIIAMIMMLCLTVSVLAACQREQTPDDTSKTEPATTEAPADANEETYLKAFDLLEQKKYDEAYALFTQLGDYKDAAKEAAYFRYMPVRHFVDFTSEGNDETITYTVTLNDKNLLATVVEEYNTGLKHTCTFTYNEFGFVTRRECSDTEGDTALYEATYDAKGNRLSETITDMDGNVTKIENTYNEKDQLVKAVTVSNSEYYESSTATFEYDAEGREIKIITVYEDGTATEEITYNEAGDILKMTWAVEGGEAYSIYDYHYDEKGRLVEILFTDDGEDGGFRKTTFNDKDQLLTEHVFYTLGFEYTNEFEYDEHGNVIKTTYANPDPEIGNDVTESEYKLVYIPFAYTDQEWTAICDATQCWDSTHW